MRRREFITLLGGAAAWPLAARAQQPERMRRIGVLLPSTEGNPEWQSRVAAFEQGLQKLGWTNGANVQIEFRWAVDPERIGTYALELVRMNPDLVYASTVVTLLPLQRATRTIPIVFTQIYDPVGSGLVASLARPDGNITGFTLGEFSLGGKMLEVLKEVAPQVSRVAVMLNPDQPPHVAMWRAIEGVAPTLAVRSAAVHVREDTVIERIMAAVASESNDGLVVLPSPFTNLHREQIAALAAHYHLPAVYGLRYAVTSGGLVSYGTDAIDQFRRSATYVDRILRGAKPADLPVQLPTKFELAVNLKTAKALGLTVPPMLLARADEVIE
jgi:putative ABC transport system substrate-binding protein